ncbi:hypothetical protein D3C71_2151920 [compost metagenome]
MGDCNQSGMGTDLLLQLLQPNSALPVCLEIGHLYTQLPHQILQGPADRVMLHSGTDHMHTGLYIALNRQI